MKKRLLIIPVICFFLLFCIDLFLEGAEFGSIDPVRWESETRSIFKYLAHAFTFPALFAVWFLVTASFLKLAATTYRNTSYYVFAVASFLFLAYYSLGHTSLPTICYRCAELDWVHYHGINFPFNWWISAVSSVLLPVIYIICAILNHKENKPFGPPEEPADEP